MTREQAMAASSHGYEDWGLNQGDYRLFGTEMIGNTTTSAALLLLQFSVSTKMSQAMELVTLDMKAL